MPPLLSKLMNAVLGAPLTLTFSGLTLILFFCPSLALSLELQFDSVSLLNPLPWFGCHLLHWSFEHLLWDLGMFAVTGYLCERACRRVYLGTLGLAVVAIPSVVAWYHPELSTYRGLSGIDTALFALLISKAWLQSGPGTEPARFWGCLGLWLTMFGKSLFELTTGEVLFVNAENFTPVPVAHLVGMICGSAMALFPGGRAVFKSLQCVTKQASVVEPPHLETVRT